MYIISEFSPCMNLWCALLLIHHHPHQSSISYNLFLSFHFIAWAMVNHTRTPSYSIIIVMSSPKTVRQTHSFHGVVSSYTLDMHVFCAIKHDALTNGMVLSLLSFCMRGSTLMSFCRFQSWSPLVITNHLLLTLQDLVLTMFSLGRDFFVREFAPLAYPPWAFSILWSFFLNYVLEE